VLPSVLLASGRIGTSHVALTEPVDKDLSALGLPEFREAAAAFALGEQADAISEGRVATAQSLSGTGACRLAGDFLARFGTGAPVYVPAGSRQAPVFRAAGIEVRQYRHAQRCALDVDGMAADLAAASDGSVVLLHACGHAGADPTRDEWGALAAALRGRRLALLFECSQLGLASGDAANDAHAVRLFERDGHRLAVAQSFAASFGLHGERAGALSLVCADADERSRVESQLAQLAREAYGSPPLGGARVVAEARPAAAGASAAAASRGQHLPRLAGARRPAAAARVAARRCADGAPAAQRARAAARRA
jgi:aspartate aminotransferase